MIICDRCGKEGRVYHTISYGTWKKPETPEKLELCMNCYDKWNKIWIKNFKEPRIDIKLKTCENILSLFSEFMNMKVKVILI